MSEKDDDLKGYGQYCPVTRAVEVLGERWSLLIVRDLICGWTRFNELSRGNPGLSRSLLSKRLRQLEQAGVIEHVGDEYLLTDAGRELEPIVMQLGAWGAKWQFEDPRADELDPALLMWWVHDRLDLSPLTQERLVLEFDFVDQRRRYWIVSDQQGPSVCDYDPGFEIDATVHAPLSVLYQLWFGQGDLRSAIRNGHIELSGRQPVVTAMPEVLQLSPLTPLIARPEHTPTACSPDITPTACSPDGMPTA